MADIFDSEFNSGAKDSAIGSTVVGGDLDVARTTNVADHGGVVNSEVSGSAVTGTQGSNVAGNDQVLAKDSTVFQNADVDGSVAANNGGGIQVAPQGGSELGALNFGSGQATSLHNASVDGGSNVGLQDSNVQQIHDNTLENSALSGTGPAVAENDFSTHNTSLIHGDHNTVAQDDSTAAADNSEHNNLFDRSFNSQDIENHETGISHSQLIDHSDFDVDAGF